MLTIVRVISTSLDKAKRRIVKAYRKSKLDVQTAKEYSDFGDDSNAPEGMVALFAETGVKGKTVVIGYLNVNKLAGPGEKRIFSLKSNGDKSIDIWLKADGTMEIGGNSDNLSRHSKMAESVNELKSDLTTLKQAFTTWVVAPGDGGGALKSISATWAGQALTKNIDDAKIDEIKTM